MRALPLAAILLAGCATAHEQGGPAEIAYDCAGREASIVYENGGWYPRARARLAFGGHDYALQSAPPTYGLRYVGETIAWSARGEEAWISELQAEGEREIAHCVRVRS